MLRGKWPWFQLCPCWIWWPAMAGNLAAASTDGVMLSWSLGGYPSANLELFQSHGDGDSEAALRQLAEKYYGKRAAPEVRRAWKAFSDAFEQFPYHGLTLYSGPQHMGPANPLYLEPTGYRASMVGIPYDALDDWRSVYPAETFVRQMEKVAEGSHADARRCVRPLRSRRGKSDSP